jgi:hypothetical protein
MWLYGQTSRVLCGIREIRACGLRPEHVFAAPHDIVSPIRNRWRWCHGAEGHGQFVLQSKCLPADRAVVVVADSSFSALDLIATVRRHVCPITRLRLDARLNEPAPTRQPKQKGRPRLKGKALPKLSAVLADRTTVWTRITMAEWYVGQTRTLDYVSGTAIWYSSGMPPAASAADASRHIDALRASIRWILVRDPSRERDPQAFLCTDLDRDDLAILGRFVFRWRIETTSRKHDIIVI